MGISTRFSIAAAWACLGACASAPAQDRFAEERVDLDSYVLLAEIAWERQQFETAAGHYLRAALISDDPAIAERTALVAHQLELNDIGLQAAGRWLDLRPGDARARQFLAVFEMRGGDHERAVELFTELLETAANPATGLELVVDILVNESDAESARAVLGPLTEAYPGTAVGSYGMARLTLRAGDFAAAQEHAEAAAALRPEWVDAQLLLARTLLIAGRTDDALELAGRFAREQREPETQLQYAELLLSAGRGDEARAILDELLADNPGLPEAVRALAFLALTENDLEGSKGHFNELRIEPRYRDEAFYYLGRIAETEGQFLQAMRSYSRVTGGNNAVEAQLRAANLLFSELGDPEGALQHLEEFGSANPNFRTEMLVAQSEVLLEMDRPEDAVQLMTDALSERPEDETLHDAHIQLYIILAQRAEGNGNLDDAQALLEEGLDLYPNDISLRYSQALLYEEQGRTRRAVSILEALVKEQPNDAGLLNALGYLMTDKGRRNEEARGYIQRALAMEPDNPAIIDSMGWVLFRLGEYEAALDYLERAYRLESDPEIAAHLVDVRWALGDEARARELLRRALEANPESRHLQELSQRLLP